MSSKGRFFFLSRYYFVYRILRVKSSKGRFFSYQDIINWYIILCFKLD